MTPAQYEAVWQQLGDPRSASEFDAREVDGADGLWVARDSAQRRHLLVRVDEGVDLSAESTHGLGLSSGVHRITGGDDAVYIDLVCLDPAVAVTFSGVAADIVSATESVPLSDRPNQVVAAVREWRWFWGVDPSRMTAAEAVGLFGELWFLTRWVGLTAESLQAWGASDGARHDFQWSDLSVEVKTSARQPPVVHTIEHLEHLDQLADPATGQLFLFSLRLARDALAGNSVRSLAGNALATVRNQPDLRAQLLAKLAARGYNPAGRDEGTVTYRVADETVFAVSAGFPRLTPESFPDGVPSGVVSLSYRLDMNACEPWRTDVPSQSTPSSWVPEVPH